VRKARILVVLLIACGALIFTPPRVLAAPDSELMLSGVNIEGNYIINAVCEKLILDGCSIGGYLLVLGSDTPVSLTISENSVLGGYIGERPAFIENDGYIGAVAAENVRFSGRGTVGTAIVGADSGIADDKKTVTIQNGEMLNKTGFADILGRQYYAGPDGRLVRGINQIDGGTFFFGRDYARQIGWVDDGNHTYYLKPDGAAAKGFTDLDGHTYCFDDEGRLQTGFVESDGSVYFFGNDGAMRTGFVDIGGDAYYFGDRGQMATDVIVNERYRADYDGKLNYRLTGNEELDAAAGRILASIIDDGMTESAKMQRIYEWMPDNIGWRGMAVDVSGGYTDERVVELALYAVRNMKCSCEHFACLENVLIRRLGYKVISIAGTRLSSVNGSWGEHSWIAITIGGQQLYFDPQYAGTHMKGNFYGCFLKTEEEFRRHHRW
jgi:hypothetical protein